MNETRIAVRAASVVAGVTLGAAAVLLGVAVTSAAVAGSSAAPERALRDVLHSPPLLVERSAAVPLAFDAVCQSDALGAPCALSGTVYVRPAGAQQYAALALRTRGDAALLASLPPGATAGDGFAYYAVVREGGGDSMTVPAGGAAAPFHAWVVPSATDVTLGVHRFGDTRRPDRALVHAPWARFRLARAVDRAQPGHDRAIGVCRRLGRVARRARPGQPAARLLHGRGRP